MKTKPLGFDWGTTADSKYYAYSTSYSPTHPAWTEWGESDFYAIYLNALGLRATVVGTWPFIGVQMFDSSKRQRPLYNNCFNSKLKGVCLPWGNFQFDWKTPPRTILAEPFWRKTMPPGITQASINCPTSINWSASEGASRRAWWSMQPRFDGEFQALNFIYELKDFKTIAKHLVKLPQPNKLSSQMRKARRQIWKAQRMVESGSTSEKLRLTASAGSRVMATAWLTKVFAIDPTVRDVVQLHGQLRTLVDDVQNEFKLRGEQPLSSYYSEDISTSESLTRGNYNLATWATGTAVKDKFTATLQYTYQYAMRGTWDALRRYYGLDMNASVAWNAMPWSFVIDYFLKVSQAMDFMRTDPNVVTEVAQYCESRNVAHEAGIFYEVGDKSRYFFLNGVPRSTGRYLVTGYSGTLYQRRVGSPNKGAALPRLTLPSTKQSWNLLALTRAMW